ncbi:MAG: purine-binding chemotaxis protein CheW [Bacteroidales bacterium]|jgi:purine-binding chemotaxis protein CheW|nr:purine-binding chemotaxis protein CheW [Bacteroidales bacterium]
METIAIDKRSSYVNFRVGNEHFAIGVNKVLEIILLEHLTHVPNTSALIKGVVNFRGTIVPVVDMHIRFKSDKETSNSNMIIVVEVNNKENNVMMGLLVDEVNDVIELEFKDIRSVPDLGIKYNPEYLEGMVDMNDQFIMVMDVDRVLSVTELAEVKELGKE